jgi:hypothetical protein
VRLDRYSHFAMEWATEPLTNKLIVLYVFLVSAVTIHYRRTVPLPPSRDLTDHSTFFESQLPLKFWCRPNRRAYGEGGCRRLKTSSIPGEISVWWWMSFHPPPSCL